MNEIIYMCVCVCVCVCVCERERERERERESILLLWFSNELNQLIKKQLFSWSHPILLICKLLFIGWGF